MVLYMAAAHVIYFRSKIAKVEISRFSMSKVFDSATFAGSLILLMGIFEPTVLAAIGSTKPFLLLAGFAGIVYSLHALNPAE